MATYTWEFGSSEEGLWFTVLYNDITGQFTVNMIEGVMDLNALWFSNGDGTSDGYSLVKSDNGLNMNGTTEVWADDGTSDGGKIVWDDYQKTSATGVSEDGYYLTTGGSVTFAADQDFNPEIFTTLGVRATSASTDGGSIKWADAEAVIDPFPDPSEDIFDSVAPGPSGNNELFVGSGIASDDFTVSQSGDLQLAMKAILRFDANNQPQNITNSNGDGSYTFENNEVEGGAGWVDGNTPEWSFIWSINTDVSGTGGKNLSDYLYALEMDMDPGEETNFFSFDPINLPYADHAIADRSGVEIQGTDTYQNLIDENPIAQQSWNYEFFDDFFSQAFDDQATGTYTIRLSVFDDVGGNGDGIADASELVDFVTIDVIVEEAMA